MADCANCSNAASYVYEPAQGNQTLYCQKHLPSFAKKPAFSGLVTEYAAPVVEVPVEESIEKVEAPKPKPSKKSASVEEAAVEAPVEETPAEEAPVEEA